MRGKRLWLYYGLVAILIPVLVFSALAPGNAQGFTPLRLIVNGKEIACDPPPFIQDGRAYVPVRFVSEALGYPVKWDPNTYSIMIGIPPEGTDLLPYDRYDCDLHDSYKVQGITYKNVITSIYTGGNCLYNLHGHFTKVKVLVAGLVPPNKKWDPKGIKIVAYGDSQEISTFWVSGDEPPKEVTLDTSGVHILKISIGDSGYFGGRGVAIIHVRGLAE